MSEESKSIKLSPAQQDALIILYNHKGLGDYAVTLFVTNRRTLQKLESEGFARFYPYSKLDKNGAWKITPAGKKYVEEKLPINNSVVRMVVNSDLSF